MIGISDCTYDERCIGVCRRILKLRRSLIVKIKSSCGNTYADDTCIQVEGGLSKRTTLMKNRLNATLEKLAGP